MIQLRLPPSLIKRMPTLSHTNTHIYFSNNRGNFFFNCPPSLMAHYKVRCS